MISARKNYFQMVVLIVASTFSLASPNVFADDKCGNSKVKGKHDILLCKEGFSVGYSNNNKGPVWVSYKIDRSSQIRAESNPRYRPIFREDAALKEKDRVLPTSYHGSDYDRGMILDSSLATSKKSFDDTRVMSATLPLLTEFNRYDYGNNGAWSVIRKLDGPAAYRHEKIVVIAGPVFAGEPKKINGVRVPDYMFKILYEPYGNKSLAIVIPHKKNNANKIGSYITSINCIEKHTGLKFSIDESLKRKVLKDLKNGVALNVNDWAMLDGNKSKAKCELKGV